MVGGTVLAQLEVLEAIEEILNWLVVTPVEWKLSSPHLSPSLSKPSNDFSIRNFISRFMNICGQTGLSNAKQTQIESFITQQKLDVLHLQEINICEDSFSNCNVISSSFNIICNNSPSKYGTASLVKSDFIPENILLDTKGRAIVFNIGQITLANLYLPSGTDATARSSREQYFSETIPQLLLNRLHWRGHELHHSQDWQHSPSSS